MEELFTLNNLISFISLTLMEVVLGIDNIIFISILTARLPEHQQNQGRLIGLSMALIIRILLLFALSWLIGLNKALFTFMDFGITGRDLILIGGGLFLIYKSTSEIHAKLEGSEEHTKNVKLLTLQAAIFQIIMLDIVFSFDSILTAIGLVDEVYIMIAAVIIAMGVMIASAKTISVFINKHPTLKMLALSFLLLIGVLLLVEGFHAHVPKGYIYFAIFFSLTVELLNMRVRKKTKPVDLKQDVSDVNLK
ncbi:MAG: TerC family protein [Bacteroidota bacterium]|nr:TerC family protein [Bacteroidota bacterium]